MNGAQYTLIYIINTLNKPNINQNLNQHLSGFKKKEGEISYFGGTETVGLQILTSTSLTRFLYLTSRA